ncbi:unnamed protein product [Caenorhabditis bovis]|uniref:LRRCT domain-containing protein n=1 Tax=Caenorhabditis bovis TaxID=2654633 RepID=A0A8S1F990_9PELO|nr:unnamed protein product [Caenorhabditis bovis]
MKFVLLLPLLFSFASAADSSAPSCPQVPEKCACKMNKHLVSVSCDGVSIAEIAQKLGTKTIDELSVVNNKDVKIDAFPFNGLRSLSIVNSSLETISPGAWKRIDKTLEHLNLNGNHLKSVPMFGELKSLLSLNMNSNQISTVSEKSMSHLSSLTQLRLEGNEISEIPPKTLDAMKSTIMLIDLSHNRFDSVPAQIIRNAANLMYLDLASNNISEINNFELMNLPYLRELRLQNNMLRRLHPMAFMNVPQLQYLYLQDNIISSLDGNRLQAFKNLEILDVSNNALYALPSLKDLPNLKQVRVDGNLIAKIETLAFSNNPKLQLISMQNNNIVQISRNSFDSLDQLIVLLIGNNSIAKIERGMLDGMRNLQQLSFRNNSLTSLDASSFPQLLHLTTLDLGHNQISDIAEGTFDRLTKLFWLDLSHNNITGFRPRVFSRKISNILLDGNQLICDEKFNDFLTYLVANKVRTFLPFQEEIRCVGPEKYAGVRLKDLMMKKANDTITQGSRLIGLSTKPEQNSLISSFLPSLGPLGNFNQAGGNIPLLSTITQTIPALRSIPGFDPAVANTRGAVPLPQKKLNDAIEQFTAPLVRFATGGQPVPSDIEQMIRSIPNLMVNVPGFGDVDLSKMDPAMIQYVLNGGQIPGIDKATLESIVKQAMQKMHAAAAANLAGNPMENQDKILPPLERLPSDLVTHVMSGEPLPGLDQDQTKTIMEYYTQQMPTIEGVPIVDKNATNSTQKPSTFNPAIFDLLKILPPGYNISRIPMEVITAVTRGEVPDMRLLPQDLLDHFRSHTSSLTSLFAGAKEKNITIEEILEKLPVFARPELSTFVPYDINELTSEMILEKEVQERHRKIRIITAIALAFVGAVTIVVLIFFVNYTKKQRRARKSLMYRNTPSGGTSSPAGQPPPVHNTSATIGGSASMVRPPMMSIPKTPINRTLESTFGQPQLCSTLIETPKSARCAERSRRL